ncbi:MAG: hypothetical protein M3Z82_06870 [Apilactobacillus sp.]|nr:hypothetical protein [Apilactobacillus sp.]
MNKVFSFRMNKNLLNLNIFIILFFLILSILSGIVLIRGGIVFKAWDFNFHLARVYEIKQSILDGNGLPKVSLNSFMQNGSAVMTMYPYINLLIPAIISSFIKNVTASIYILFILRNFFALIMAYFSCYTFSKSKYISIIFSMVYTLSALVLHENFYATDLGISTSLIFLPLVLFGSIQLIEKYKWRQLAIGLIFISLSHIITAVMSFGLCLGMIALNTSNDNLKPILKSVLKCLFVILLVTSIFWIPFMVLTLSNNIAMPSMSWMLTGVQFTDLANSIFSDSVYFPYINIFAFAGLIIGIINYRQMNIYVKQMFFISLLLLFVASPLFPWNMLNGTFIRETFQRPYRVYIIAQLLLSYIFADGTLQLCKNNKRKKLAFIFISILTVMTQMVGQKQIYDTAKNNQYSNERIIDAVNKDANYYTDYFPRNAVKIKNDIINKQGELRDGKKFSINIKENGIMEFKLLSDSNDIRFPFVMYNGIKYNIKVDDVKVDYHVNNDSQLYLKHMDKGTHTLKINVEKSFYDYFSYLVSFGGLLLFWIDAILGRKRKRM